jgi:hypothetical protein
MPNRWKMMGAESRGKAVNRRAMRLMTIEAEMRWGESWTRDDAMTKEKVSNWMTRAGSRISSMGLTQRDKGENQDAEDEA